MTDEQSTAPPVIERALAEQLAQHIGESVAVDLQQVVGSGATAAEAIESALAAGHTDPLVFHVARNPERVAFF